jgi:hypothetical protein
LNQAKHQYQNVPYKWEGTEVVHSFKTIHNWVVSYPSYAGPAFESLPRILVILNWKHSSSFSYPCTDVTVLLKNPTDGLYTLTSIYSHCYSPTSFSPQGAILWEYWYISWAGSAECMPRCKYQIKEWIKIIIITETEIKSKIYSPKPKK